MIERLEDMVVAECQECWALWTWTPMGIPPSQSNCGHFNVLTRKFVADGPIIPEKELMSDG